MYLLKWKGYSKEENSWEPSSNLFCSSILKAYRQKHNLFRPSFSKEHTSPGSESTKKENVAKLKKVAKTHSSINGLASSHVSQMYMREKRLEAGKNDCSLCCSDNWCVQAMKKLNKKPGKKTRSKVKALPVSISLSNGITVDNSHATLIQCSSAVTSLSASETKLTREVPNSHPPAWTSGTCSMAHRLLCIRHDHTYCTERGEREELATPKLPLVELTPPPSAEPCDGVSFTSDSPPPKCYIYSVQISPPPSPSPHPIYLHTHSQSVLPASPKLPPMDKQSSIHHDSDLDSSSQHDYGPTFSPCSSPPLSGDSLKLHISSASSVSSDLDICAREDGDVTGTPAIAKPCNNLSEKLQSVLTLTYRVGKKANSTHKALKSHSRNGSIFSRWRKGPLPLPRSFSKRLTGTSQLQTKAAKLQLSEVVPSLPLMSLKQLKNDSKQPHANGLVNQAKSKKLSLSLKSRSHSLDLVRTKKLNALAYSTPNNENQLAQVTPKAVEFHVPVVRHNHDLSHEYVYKEQLMNWQYELNKQRDGTDDIIYVENEVDKESPPSDFNYICSNVYAVGVPNPSHPDLINSLCGCECYYLGRKCGPKSEYCCANMAGSKFAYTPAGKVKVPAGTPIYECNAKCSCPSDCSNRIVQLGRKIPLCIFRTVGRGWGVKTIEPIKPNTFVTEYVGEVITNEEAERRGTKCDAEGITYLFDLDFEDDNSAFTIDAAKHGNISHFFNHSVSVI